MPNPNQRPLGITLFASLLLLISITNLVIAFYRIFSGTSLVVEEALLLPKYSLVALDSFSLFFSIWTTTLSIGLWKMRRWSWLGTLITQSIWVLMTISAGVVGWPKEDLLPSDIFGLVASLIFAAVIVCYFLRPKIKSAFRVN